MAFFISAANWEVLAVRFFLPEEDAYPVVTKIPPP